MASGGLRYYLSLDSRGFSKGARQAEGDLSRLQRVSGTSFNAMRLGGLAAAAAVGTTLAAGIRTGYQEMAEAQKVGAQTAAVIKSTGGAAGVTRAQVEQLAGSLQGLTGIEDDQIQSAQNMLLTFTKISKETFPAATKATLDLSVAFGKDMNASAVMLGKALQDPIRGVTALNRVGVTFTAQQKEQIKAMVEAGKTADAQKLILAELNKQVGGSGAAFGRTLPGQIERAKRAWEDVTQELMTQLLPAFTDMVQFINRNMPRIRVAIQGVADTVRGVVKFVRAIIAQDWTQAWQLARHAATKALQALIPALKGIGKWIWSAAKDIGAAIGRGLYDGIYAALQKLPGPVRRFLGLAGSRDTTNATGRQNFDFGAGPVTSRAVGGWIPGRYDARDDVPALLSRGEVVLNPRQASLVGIGRINSALAATGGVMGGHAFARGGVAGCGCAACRGGRYASGGWVYPAPGASKGGGPGGGTHSRSENGYRWQDDDAYDLMGSDGGKVVAPQSGVITATRPFNPDSRYWGMAAYLNVPGGQFYLKHMKSMLVRAGQRVSAGQTIGYLGNGVNGGPHLHIAANPISLLYKAVGGARVPGSDGDDGGHATPDTDISGAPPPGLSLKSAREAAPRLIRGGQATPDGLTEIDSIDRRHEDDDLEARAARAAGVPESGILKMQKKELEQDVADIDVRISKIKDQIANLKRARTRHRNEMVARGTKPARRLALRDLISGINDRLTELQDAVKSLATEKRQLLRQMVILGYDITDAEKDESASGGDSDDGGSGVVSDAGKTTSTSPGLTDYLASIGEFGAVKRGAGDLGSGGRTAWDAAWTPAGGAVTVVVQTLHPGDPSVLAEVGRTVVASMSGLPSTPSTTYMSGA